MAALFRTCSRESAAPRQASPDSLDGDVKDAVVAMSGPPSPSNAKAPRTLASSGRVPSHSLLSAANNAAVTTRKSRFADIGTSGGDIGRASISMPPPTNKPSSIYRPSGVRRPTGARSSMDSKDGQFDGAVDEKAREDAALPETLEKTTSSSSIPVSEPHSPSAVSDSSLKPPGLLPTKAGDRLSFSSLYSLGSAIYNGTTGVTSPPQSTASSTAGSVKSVEHATSAPIPISPALGSSHGIGSTKGEVSSPVTTATDLVSVPAYSQPLHQGLRYTWLCRSRWAHRLTKWYSTNQCIEGTCIKPTICLFKIS